MYYLIVFVSFILYNAVPAVGAWCAASRMNRGGRTGFLAFFLTVWMLEGLASFGIAASFALFDPSVYFLVSLGVGIAVCLLVGLRRKKIPSAEEYGLPVRVLLGLGAALFLLIGFKCAIIHSGTDTFLYHLYFPAMWIRMGRLTPIAIHGLPCEYLPPYSEMLYGWLMMPTGTSFLAGFLQPLALLGAACALAMLAGICSCGPLGSMLLFTLLPGTGILCENAMLCYSDVLTGSFLLTGTVFLITGAVRGGDKRLGILAGLVMGCTAGMKYSGLLAAPLVTGVFCIVFLFRKKWRPYTLCIIPAALFAGGCAYLENFLRTGNPFYPVRFGAVFPQGIDFFRPPVISAWPQLWEFFVTGDSWGFNLPTVLLYGSLPAAFFLFFLLKRRRLHLCERLLLVPVCCGTVLFFVHLFFYPAIAQPRQFIPAVMLLTPGFIPLLRACKMPQRFRRLSVAAAFVVLLSLYAFPFTTKCLFLPLFFLPFLAGALLFRKRYADFVAVPVLVFLLLLPACFLLRIKLKSYTYEQVSDPVRSRAAQCVQDDFFSTGRPCRIASVALWNSYMFMEDQPGNLVLAISPSEKDTVHPHEAGDIRTLRNPPASCEVWLKRLRDAGITHLAIEVNAQHNYFENNRIELDYALAHPDVFEPVVNDESFYLFRVRREKMILPD